MTLDRNRLQSLMQREQTRFVNENPKSKAIFERGKKSLLSGVPMNWMVKWAGAFWDSTFACRRRWMSITCLKPSGCTRAARAEANGGRTAIRYE